MTDTGAKVVAGMLERDEFSRWLGVELVHLQPGRCTLRMRVRSDMVNGFGVAHGGIAFSLADSAMAFACNDGNNVTVAVGNSISYPAAIHVDDELVATAEQETASRKLGYYRVTVRRQDGETVALFHGTVYQTRQPHPLSS
jgi:acyl-CoA thioesterase